MMKSMFKHLRQLDDALNPIVVKELRQAVAGKFLFTVLILFLILQLFTMGISLTRENVSWQFNAGREIFSVLLGLLLGTCLLFIPLHTGIRLANERSDANVDLLFITTLKPRAIVWGKFLAALILTVLIYSACLPFMTFTYLLRGIDLPSIFVLLCLDFLIIAASIQLAILIGSIPGNRIIKALLGLVGLIVFIYAFIITMVGSFQLLRSGIGSRLGSWEFWGTSLGILAGGLSVIGLFAVLSIATIAPPSANRALPVRLFVVGIWFITGVVFGIWSKARNDVEVMIGWVGLNVALHCIGIIVAVNERETLGRRVLHAIPRSRILRPLAFLFYSGAASGVLWSSLMILLTLLIGGVWAELAQNVFRHMGGAYDLHRAIEIMAGLGFYAFSYALGASLIRRRFFANLIPQSYTWGVTIVMLAIGSTVPPLTAFFVSKGWSSYDDAGPWLLGNPYAIIISDNYRSMCIVFAAVCAVVIGLVSIPWFFRQIKNFRPPTQRET